SESRRPRSPARCEPGGGGEGPGAGRAKGLDRRAPERGQGRRARPAGAEEGVRAVLSHHETHAVRPVVQRHPPAPERRLRSGHPTAAAQVWRSSRVPHRRARSDPPLRRRPPRGQTISIGTSMSPKHRSGFATLIGRPNVGKSTLLNRLTGEKLAIISHKPQTTRHRILGVVHRPDAQIALVDTPGVHDAKGQLNRYMLEVALNAAEDTDVNLFLIEPVDEVVDEVSPGNRAVMEALERANRPTILVINKIDTVPKPLL